MSVHRTITRYYLILGILRRPGFPSFEEIHRQLEEHDFTISTRTLQRDLAKIKADFGIEIIYDSYRKGYYLDLEYSEDIDSLMKFMELAVLTGTFDEVFKDRKGVRDIISFDCEESIRGVQYISRILFAIKNRKEVIIKYQKFSDSEPYERSIKPGLLREYENRWYLAGLSGENNELKLYALDRTLDVSLGERRFDSSEIADLKERFVHVIGISQVYKKPEFIEITFKNDQANYVKTLPWHASQEIISTSKEETTFRYFVVANYELEQKILSEGDNIVGIEPGWLAEKIDERRG